MSGKRILLAFATLAAAAGIHAQEPPTPGAPADIEARKASVASLESHITQREQRLAEWARDIVELDARIEKRVDGLVTMLAGLRDSQDSRTAVSQIKKEAIEALKQGIDRYVRKRKEIRELIRGGDSSALGDLDKFDQRIIKRVDQIAELTKSIPTHADVNKYESTGGSYWDGYYQENTRVSDQWRQNQRDTRRSDQQRNDTAKALREALERLDQRRRTLDDSLANRQLTDSARQLYTTELGQIDAYEDHIRKQLEDVTTATTGAGTPIGLEQAHDIERMIADARADLREDVSRLFRAYDQFVRGRSYLEGLKQTLAARKEWLEKNTTPQPGNPPK